MMRPRIPVGLVILLVIVGLAYIWAAAIFVAALLIVEGGALAVRKLKGRGQR